MCAVVSLHQNSSGTEEKPVATWIAHFLGSVAHFLGSVVQV
jgi:hypothetical protein